MIRNLREYGLKILLKILFQSPVSTSSYQESEPNVLRVN